ncbi:HNH endonuclease [Streptomyces sp. KCTC 0041BP]|uniref:RNA-guided endonuclease IscB n=1 Tax=Streptomyces sp. KCTC 0041BP TaxID=201500 RepID=UPI001AE89ED5|nr:RNA-guided endonuclease IscB [Streptomyces sp. KCTC 0041BP]MBP0934087.1 HNH endonuclease [Streptomyces sp. KCTC 0041BP]
MATFSAGQQIHRAVPPQRRALESAGADTPRIGHETARGRHVPPVAPSGEHVREETVGGSPAADGDTFRPAEAGETPRERHPSVFVLDRHGAPLQPCHPARARKLLGKGRAVVARHTPFVIRLKDRTIAESTVEGVELGIDPGSRHTGIAVFTATGGERRGRFAVRLDHRGAQIRRKLQQRSDFRRGRRTRNLRYRAPRLDNRARREGWLAPSLRHRVDTTVAWVDRLARWAPVTAVHVESVAFDTHAISSGGPLEGAEYQHGTLHGTEVREYLRTKWKRACGYCGATGVPLNVDHVRPTSRGGSDRVSNLVLACVPCNQEKTNRPVEEFARAKTRAARILAQAKVPLRDAAAVNATRWALRRALEARLPTHGASGGRTRWNRIRNHLPKTHTLDALAVGELGAVTETVNRVLIAGCTGRGTHARTRSDAYGFPRLRLPRRKRFFGFMTGDLVRACVPGGKNAGTHTGRVAVRASGSFAVRTQSGLFTARHTRFRLLQRADGYAYQATSEGRPGYLVPRP